MSSATSDIGAVPRVHSLSRTSLLVAIEQSMMVVELDLSGRIVSANDNFTAHVGESEDDLRGKLFAHVMSDPKAICPSHPQALDVLRAGKAWWGVIQCRTADANERWLDISCSPMREANAVIGAVALAVDVTESVATRTPRPSTPRASVYDPLTGLPNRGLLYAQLEQAITEMGLRDASLAVVIVDIDRFRQVNDSLGQVVGDALLREVAQRLTGAVRGGDVVGRLAGDQFMVVLPQCDAKGVEVVSKHLRDQLVRPCSFNAVEIKPSVSVGISLYPDNGRDIDTLVKHAEFALSLAKESGRSGIHFFSPVLKRLATDRRDLEQALHVALEQGGLSLHYQPQVSMDGAVLRGVEALARWHDPQRGVISPDVFVSIAEDGGMIDQLGEWALLEGCSQLAKWRAQGLAVPSVSVNLSPTNFQNVELPEIIGRTLALHGLVPADLTLEMTESVMMGKRAETMHTLTALFDMGVRLSMDDFGTGYSSLGHLRRIPVSELKLDRSFVTGLENDDASRTLASAIIRIGDSLGMSVVAEGVETAAQRDFLLEQGCLIAQGYFFSRPLTAENFGTWLRARR
ncbi:MAG: GGDEF and EAL domain-containing protein [Comamonadaceae bacterium]|nr:MAG: GGDEF and EAL domain-containing protein [Comamonadaceae bacterium]